jgi:hypothetical protein
MINEIDESSCDFPKENLTTRHKIRLKFICLLSFVSINLTSHKFELDAREASILQTFGRVAKGLISPTAFDN